MTTQDETGLREAAQRLRAAAVKAGAHIVVTTDYPDGVKAFGILCDAIDVMDAALAANPAPAGLDVERLADAFTWFHLRISHYCAESHLDDAREWLPARLAGEVEG